MCILLQAALALSVLVPQVRAANICPVAKITGPVTGGAANATIPIEVPQFREGLTPTLDLTYSSAGASGWLGRGWDLELGSIQKRGKPGYERYYYVLGDDVQELVKVSTEYGHSGQWKYEYYVLRHNRPAGKFCREGDTKEKLYSTWYGTLNGLTRTFGQWVSDLSDSSQKTNAYHKGGDDDAFVEKWSLLSTRDRNDNYLSITYNKYYDWNGYVYYPEKVSYGNKDKTTYSVNFTLDNATKNLNSIQVKHLDKEIARYDLVFECSADTRYNRLRTVTRSSFGKSRPAIEVDWTYYSEISPYCDYVHTIDNGEGGLTTYDYTPYTYAVGKKVAVLSKVTTDNGQTSETRTSYAYTGGALNSYNSLIFKQITVTRPDLTEVRTQFTTGDSARAGLPEWYEQSGPIRQKTTYSWGEADGTVHLDKKTTQYYSPVTGAISGSVSVIEFHHNDTYQFLKQVLLSGPGRNKTILDYTWEDRLGIIEKNPKFYWLQPTSFSVSEMVGDAKKLQRKSEFQYSDKGRLSKILTYVNGSTKAMTEVTQFDAYGNPRQVKDPNGNITTFEYDDALQLYPKKITAPNGLTISTSYDYDKFGRIKASKDENGNETSYTYDEFGRPSYVDYPDGGADHFVYTEYDGSANPRSVMKEMKVGGAWEFASKKYFDGFGRVVESVKPVGDGSFSITNMHYDHAGRLSQVIGPYAAGTYTFIANPYLSGYCDPGIKGCRRQWAMYDDRGRLIAVKKGVNQKYPWLIETADTKYEYPDLRTVKIIDPDGKVSHEFLDDIGRIIKKTDGNGSPTYYTYNAAGDLTSITGPLGDTTKSTFTYDLRGNRTSMKGPAGDTWADPVYDNNGNLRQETGPAGETVNCTYDSVNRVTKIEYIKTGMQTKTTTYTYDNDTVTNGKGRIYTSWHSDGIGSTYNYDRMGRVAREEKTMYLSPYSFPVNYVTSYAYDPAGRLDSITHPDGTVVYYDYVPGSELVSRITLPHGDWADLTYTAGDKIASKSYSNGVSTFYSYYPESSRLRSLSTENSSGARLQGWEYTYFNSGDMKTKKDLLSGKMLTYSYDNLHQLLSELSDIANDSYSYKYDLGGNITERSEPYQVYTYRYDANRPYMLANIASGQESHAVTSDRSGNITEQPWLFPSPRRLASYTGDGNVAKIDYAGIEAATVNFSYEPSGGRAAKFKFNFKSSTLKGWSRYISPGYMIDQFSKVKYFSVGDRKIAKIDKNDNVVWFSHDHLGSTTLVTDRAGARLESTDYAPFGDIRYKSAALTNTDHMYTGQEYDREEMMYYYKSRFYDPAIGRFTTPDAIVPFLFEPKALHPYSYVGNNPLRYADPTGHAWEDRIDEAQLHLAHISALFAGGHVEPGSQYEAYLRNLWAQAYENLFVFRVRRWTERLAGHFRLQAMRLSTNNTIADNFYAFFWRQQGLNIMQQFNAMGLPPPVPLNMIANNQETPRHIAERVDHAEAILLNNAIPNGLNLEGFIGQIFANPVGPDGLTFRGRIRLTMPERLSAPIPPVNQGGSGNVGSDKPHPDL
jgi:RHS repeat-associated protein